MRVDIVKIPTGVTVIVAIPVQYHRRNPDRSGTERFDVVQLLLNALEVAPVDTLTGGSVVIPVRVIIGNISIEEPIGHDLVDALALPKVLGTRRPKED